MDLPPPVQGPDAADPEPASGPGPEQPAERGVVRAGELEWRLSQLEAGLRHIDRRLDRMEESVVQAVARETQAVAGDLRRTVSELGRRLVLELPQVLARHRDEIVAELRPPEPPPAPGPGPHAPAVDDLEAAAGGVPVEPESEPEPAGPPADPVKRRRRVHGLRQRDA